ncbi:MAG: bifunctional oligoribonuclease/PAP phosphatase NrnA [Bacteroidetes bacterium]|nr:bifunctional oligoribonuclease/PAP phosphatase NrnA [Bacteroidota bacterium]
MQKEELTNIINLLSTPRKIVITAHTNPDGDAIGSGLAMYGYLQKKGHDVMFMIPDPDPEFLHWMPFHSLIMVYRDQQELCLEAIKKAEVIFCLDYNSLGRLGRAEEPVRNSNAAKILIDHHRDPAPDFDYILSIIETSSTSELVYDFISACGDAEMIDQDIAACIYAGIITDTGSFSYSCNYEKTYLITADLYRKGIDGEHIHRHVYDTYSEGRLRLLGYSISEKLVVLKEYHTAYIYLSKEDLDRFNYQVGDTEDIVNYGLSVAGINLAALFTERDGVVRISLRSKGNFSVNDIARKYFNGGGHVNAAGANSTISLEETVRIFVEMLPDYKEKLTSVY